MIKMLDYVLAALVLLERVSAYTKNTADDKLSGEIKLAVEALRRVVNTPVLKSQLTKIEHRW